MSTPPPVDRPIGPPIPVRTITTTPAGVRIDGMIPADHPAYPAMLAAALTGLSVETITGAPGTPDQDDTDAERAHEALLSRRYADDEDV